MKYIIYIELVLLFTILYIFFKDTNKKDKIVECDCFCNSCKRYNQASKDFKEPFINSLGTVIFTNEQKHIEDTSHFPLVGTKGKILDDEEDDIYTVQWELGSTSGDDIWIVDKVDCDIIKNCT